MSRLAFCQNRLFALGNSPTFHPMLKKNEKNTLQKQAFLAKKGFFCGVFGDFVLLGCFSQVADCQLKKL